MTKGFIWEMVYQFIWNLFIGGTIPDSCWQIPDSQYILIQKNFCIILMRQMRKQLK